MGHTCIQTVRCPRLPTSLLSSPSFLLLSISYSSLLILYCYAVSIDGLLAIHGLCQIRYTDTRTRVVIKEVRSDLTGTLYLFHKVLIHYHSFVFQHILYRAIIYRISIRQVFFPPWTRKQIRILTITYVFVIYFCHLPSYCYCPYNVFHIAFLSCCES